jgi:hypothetical protein
MNELLELLAETFGEVRLVSVKEGWHLTLDGNTYSGFSPEHAITNAFTRILAEQVKVPTLEPTIARVILSDGTELNTFAGQPVSRLGKEVMPT